MSDIFDLDADGAAALEEEARRNPLRKEDLPTPAWTGAGEALKGLLRPSAGAGRTLLMAGAPVASAIDEAARFGDWLGGRTAEREELGLGPTRVGATDWYFRNVVDPIGGRATDYWTADPAAMGSASKALSVGSNVLGSVPQMIGMTGTFLANSALDPAVELIDQGVDTQTAAKVGGVNLLANAVGLKIPAAWGNTLTQRLVTGAGSNLAVGAIADAASSDALDAGGYEEQAAGYSATDPYARLLDGLMGAAFGWKANVDAPRVAPAQRDAVLTTRNNDHLHRQTLPGEPARRAGECGRCHPRGRVRDAPGAAARHGATSGTGIQLRCFPGGTGIGRRCECQGAHQQCHRLAPIHQRHLAADGEGSQAGLGRRPERTSAPGRAYRPGQIGADGTGPAYGQCIRT